MITATIEIKTNKLPGMASALNRRVAEICESAAFACEAQAKVNAPVDTGTLRNSIQAEPERPQSWIVAPHTDYAVFVELGTGRQHAQPYLTPAAELVRPIFIGQMQAVPSEIAR